MSIQQSINQAISGSLYLLGQSTLFRTLKEERDLKVQKDRIEKEAKLNAPRDKGANPPQPQEQGPQGKVSVVQNAPVLPVQQDISADTIQEEKKDAPRDFEYSSQIAEFDPQQYLQTTGRYFAYSQQVADFDLQQHLQRKVAEASRTEQLSREFRGQLTGRGDTLG